LNFNLRAGSKFNCSSKFGVFFKFRSPSWLEIQLQLEICFFLNFDLRAGSNFNAVSKFGFLKISSKFNSSSKFGFFSILNFDLRAGSKFYSSSKFGFSKFWISFFELSQNSIPARNSAFENLNSDFRAGSKFNSSFKFGFLKILNFDLRAGSKFNFSSKFWFWKFWISIFELTRNSTPARNSAFLNLEFRSSSWLEIQLQLEIRVLKILTFDLLSSICVSLASRLRMRGAILDSLFRMTSSFYI
jgi:hypothetical protein